MLRVINTRRGVMVTGHPDDLWTLVDLWIDADPAFGLLVAIFDCDPHGARQYAHAPVRWARPSAFVVTENQYRALSLLGPRLAEVRDERTTA